MRNRHRHAVEQASRRWRTRRKFFISTQVVTKDGPVQIQRVVEKEVVEVEKIVEKEKLVEKVVV